MRIVQAVTLISDDGAYGGPVAVATAQCEELIRRGHDVTLVAGWRGRSSPPDRVGEVPAVLAPVRQLPGAGLLGAVSPGALAALRRLPADVVHLHAGRDLQSQLAAMSLRHRRYILQTHGMVMPRRGAGTRLYDAVLTRPALRRASARLALTEQEERGLEGVSRGIAVTRLPNGLAPSERVEVSAWAGREIVFAARLHPRKRAHALVEAAAVLRDRGVHARFVIFGPDEGELAGLRQLITHLRLEEVVRYEGPLPPGALSTRLRSSAVFVLPSRDEPFPMALLEAMSAGVPSICTSSCGIAPELLATGGAAVTDGSPEGLAAVIERWLASQEAWETASLQARRAVETTFSIRAVVDDLLRVYASAPAGAAL